MISPGRPWLRCPPRTAPVLSWIARLWEMENTSSRFPQPAPAANQWCTGLLIQLPNPPRVGCYNGEVPRNELQAAVARGVKETPRVGRERSIMARGESPIGGSPAMRKAFGIALLLVCIVART